MALVLPDGLDAIPEASEARGPTRSWSAPATTAPAPAVRLPESPLAGLCWKPLQDPIVCRGQWDESVVDQAKELGTAMAARLAMGVF